MKSPKIYKLALIGLAIALLGAAGQVQQALNLDRQRLGLTRVTVLQNAPPVLAFTTVALGGFRGLIANALWMRANELQESEKFFEMVQLADWITKLEPHYVQVWLVQAWNMAYNISVKFKEPEDRWRWVQRGIELLRDDGLRFNPNETLIYRELAWFFQHKLGQNLDDAHGFYKQCWANEMQTLFKGRPRLQELAADPKNQTPETKACVKILSEKYKMDPKLMLEVDQLYGPLEWRLPDAHAIYWAELGRRSAKPKDQDGLRRVIYQTMQQAFLRGGLTEDKYNKQGFVLGPNFDLMDKVNSSYETMMAADEKLRDHVSTGHRNFLLTAIYLLYVDNRVKDATRWFAYLKKTYPKAVPASISLEEFVINQVTSETDETDANRTTGIIEGLIHTSYRYRMIGEDDQATSYELMARRIWEKYQAKVAGAEGRIGLKPFQQLKDIVRDQMLERESPEMAARLRTALNLPAPTNAPAAGTSTNAPAPVPTKPD